MKEYYVLFTCDQWKSYDSMKLVGIASTRKNLNRALKKMAQKKSIDINIKNFKVDNDNPINEINSLIDYAYIQTINMNEFDI